MKTPCLWKNFAQFWQKRHQQKKKGKENSILSNFPPIKNSFCHSSSLDGLHSNFLYFVLLWLLLFVCLNIHIECMSIGLEKCVTLWFLSCFCLIQVREAKQAARYLSKTQRISNNIKFVQQHCKAKHCLRAFDNFALFSFFSFTAKLHWLVIFEIFNAFSYCVHRYLPVYKG